MVKKKYAIQIATVKTQDKQNTLVEGFSHWCAKNV